MYRIELLHSALTDLPEDVLKQSGCYLLTSIQWPDGLPRLGKEDPKSILYIGKADTMGKRVSSLITSVQANRKGVQNGPVEKGHQALSRKYYRIRERVNIEQLFIEIYPVPNIDAKVVESYMLETYVKEFGELPPLNGQYGSCSLEEAFLKFKEMNIIKFDFL